MPDIETQGRHQRAVLWEAADLDNYAKPTISEAVEILVKWNEQRQESLDAQGNTIAIDATAVVGRHIEVDSIMKLGTIEDLGEAPTGLMMVSTYSETRDIKGRGIFRSVGLIRYGDTLPTIV